MDDPDARFEEARRHVRRATELLDELQVPRMVLRRDGVPKGHPIYFWGYLVRSARRFLDRANRNLESAPEPLEGRLVPEDLEPWFNRAVAGNSDADAAADLLRQIEEERSEPEEDS